MEIVLKPIGVVHTKHSDDEVRNSYFGVDGWVEIYPEYEEGLKGIEGFSHIIVLGFLHKVLERQRRVVEVRPRGLKRFGIDISDIPLVGVFCTDSPHRPNPIALSIVRLVERRGRDLFVKGLDLFNGTPVLDIKPYTPGRCINDVEVPSWYKTLRERAKKVLGEVTHV